MRFCPPLLIWWLPSFKVRALPHPALGTAAPGWGPSSLVTSEVTSAEPSGPLLSSLEAPPDVASVGVVSEVVVVLEEDVGALVLGPVWVGIGPEDEEGPGGVMGPVGEPVGPGGVDVTGAGATGPDVEVVADGSGPFGEFPSLAAHWVSKGTRTESETSRSGANSEKDIGSLRNAGSMGDLACATSHRASMGQTRTAIGSVFAILHSGLNSFCERGFR